MSVFSLKDMDGKFFLGGGGESPGTFENGHLAAAALLLCTVSSQDFGVQKSPLSILQGIVFAPIDMGSVQIDSAKN